MALTLDFVTFHVSLANGSEVHPNHTPAHRQYLAMIDMMAGSARLFAPRARVTVLTDRDTSFAGSRARLSLSRSDIDSARLMLARTRAQLAFVEASALAAPMVILDSDVLVNASLDEVFAKDFDVALTWRSSHDQPINGGFMILNNRRPEVAKAFFRRFAQVFVERYSDKGAWYGDQLALRDVVGLTHRQMRRQEIAVVDGCRVLLLPCESHNYSPENRFSEVAAYRPDKVVMHFKGERKRLMAPYWHAWLRPVRSRSPLAHWRALRERRRLAQLIAGEAGLPPLARSASQ